MELTAFGRRFSLSNTIGQHAATVPAFPDPDRVLPLVDRGVKDLDIAGVGSEDIFALDNQQQRLSSLKAHTGRPDFDFDRDWFPRNQRQGPMIGVPGLEKHRALFVQFAMTGL
jgi:hypothetical protein